MGIGTGCGAGRLPSDSFDEALRDPALISRIADKQGFFALLDRSFAVGLKQAFPRAEPGQGQTIFESSQFLLPRSCSPFFRLLGFPPLPRLKEQTPQSR